MFALLLLGFVPSLFYYLALVCRLTLVALTFVIQHFLASVSAPNRGKLQPPLIFVFLSLELGFLF
jgi:hypothetical protein